MVLGDRRWCWCPYPRSATRSSSFDQMAVRPSQRSKSRAWAEPGQNYHSATQKTSNESTESKIEPPYGPYRRSAAGEEQ
uniref:Uncharacterized protein n=1 Tax=Anopheles albimanus TaxID=7167 RepID=A0A182FYS4_ANOAL